MVTLQRAPLGNLLKGSFGMMYSYTGIIMQELVYVGVSYAKISNTYTISC